MRKEKKEPNRNKRQDINRELKNIAQHVSSARRQLIPNLLSTCYSENLPQVLKKLWKSGNYSLTNA